LVIYSSLGARIRGARIMRDLTGEQLARLVGCHKSTITMLEAGTNRRTRYIGAMARALGVTSEWLELGIGDPPWRRGGVRTESAQEEVRRILRQDRKGLEK